MTTKGTRTWLSPLCASLAVLAVLLVAGSVIWQQRPGASGGDSGSGASPAQPSTGASDAPTDPIAPTVPTAPTAQAAEPLRIDSFYAYDATHLALNYTTGVPGCYGKAGKPVVVEDADSVLITLPRLPVKQKKGVACIDIAMVRSVDITLSSPLAERAVRDGSDDGRVVGRGTAPGDDDQAQ